MDAVNQEGIGEDVATTMTTPAATIDIGRLLFQRWLVDNGKAEHGPASEASGELIFSAADYTIANPGARRAWIPADWSATQC